MIKNLKSDKSTSQRAKDIVYVHTSLGVLSRNDKEHSQGPF